MKDARRPSQSPRRALLWVAVAAIGNAGLTIVGFRIIGDLVGPAGFAEAMLIYGIILLISGVASGSVSQALARLYFDATTAAERGRIFFSGGAMVLLAYVLLLPLTLVLATVSRIPGETLIALSCANLVVEMFRPICTAWLQSETRFVLLAVSQWIDAGLRPVFAVMGTDCGFSPSEVVLGAYLLASISSVAVLSIGVLRTTTWVPPARKEAAMIGRYALPLVGNGVFGWLANAGDRYLVAGALGLHTAGVYVAASAIGARLSLLLGNVFETHYRPRLYVALASRDAVGFRSTCRSWVRDLAFTGAVVLAALLLLMPLVQRHLLADDFREGSALVITMSYVSFWAIGLAFLPQRINYAHGRTGVVSIVEIIGTILMTVVVFLSSREYGLSGAAVGLAISGLLRLLVTCFAAFLVHRASGTAAR